MVTLITGGCGFIGAAIARKVVEKSSPDDEIILVDSLQRHGLNDDVEKLLAHPNVTFHKLDLTDRDRLFELTIPVDRLYHIAAMIGVELTTQRPVDVLKVNTLSTLNIFDWFEQNRKPEARILFSSSSEVYAGGIGNGIDIAVPTPEHVPLVISDISNPRFSYAVSKLWGESILNAWVKEKHLFALITRYHNIYGPNMGFDHVIPQVVMRVHRKELPFRIYGARQTRSFCWIDDAAEATWQVMESADIAPGAIVHIGNQLGEISIQELYDEILKSCGWQPSQVVHENPPSGSVQRRCPDTGFLTQLTGFDQWTSLEDGIKKTVAWYLNKLENRGK